MFDRKTLIFALSPVFAYQSKMFANADEHNKDELVESNYIDDLMHYTEQDVDQAYLRKVVELSSKACDSYMRFCRHYSLSSITAVDLEQAKELTRYLSDALDIEDLTTQTLLAALHYYPVEQYGDVDTLIVKLLELELDDSYESHSEIWLTQGGARAPRYRVRVVMHMAHRLLVTDTGKLHPQHCRKLNCYGFEVSSTLGRGDIMGYEIGEIATCKGRITFG